jgi:hypothetical protein
MDMLVCFIRNRNDGQVARHLQVYQHRFRFVEVEYQKFTSSFNRMKLPANDARLKGAQWRRGKVPGPIIPHSGDGSAD